MPPKLPSDSVLSASELFRDEWEDVIRQFERAWLNGESPDIAKFLPEEATARAAILPQLVLVDLEFRLKRREPARVETYLQRFPELAGNPTAIQEFLSVEFHLRRRFEPLLSPAEYQTRFPQWDEFVSKLDWHCHAHNDTAVFRPPACESPAESGVLSSRVHDSITALRSQDDPIQKASSRAEWSDLEIREELGRGGMGTVYLAWQRSLERLVAVKVLRSFVDLPADAHLRFRREAVAAARLHHPNIVQVFSFGEVGHVPFYVMEYVAGGSLAQRLTGKPQSPRECVQLVEIIARAMHFAHQQQWLHRDLKPGNILLMPDGTPKLGDFGLVLKLDDGAERTSGNRLIGTPSYMAPEQALNNGGQLTAAADVYSLGAVLYELLTGQPPFVGTTSLDVLNQLKTRDPVTPRRFVPKLDTDLETICLKCLRKEPSARYGSALEFADDLRRFLEGQPIRARRHPVWSRAWSWCRRQPILAVTSVLLLFAIACVAWLLPIVHKSWRYEADAGRRLSEMRSVFRRSHAAFSTRMEKQTNLLGLRRVRQHYEAFLTEHAADATLAIERANAHFALGTVLRMQGEEAAGVEHWRKSQQLFEEVSPTIDARDSWALYWLTFAHLKLASWHRANDRLEDAWSTLDRARRCLEALRPQGPSTAAVEYCRAWCYSRYGTLGQKEYRPEEAVVFCEQADRIWRKLMSEEMAEPFDWSPRTTWSCYRLGPNLLFWGQTLQALERNEESLEQFEELLTLAETSLKSPPATTTTTTNDEHKASWQELKLDAQHGIARGHYMIGKQLLNEARPELAVSHFQESIRNWTSVVDAGTASASQRSYHASSHFHLAVAHRRQGHRTEAAIEYQRAMELWEPMLAETGLQGFNRDLAQRHLSDCRTELQKLQDSNDAGH